jgi:hypothetical protein
MHNSKSEYIASAELAPANQPLLKDSAAEAILDVHDGFLAKDRVGKARIPFVKIGRAVRYRRADIEAFIAANIRKSTSDAGALSMLEDVK